MKKIFFIIASVLALVVLDLAFPRVEVEAQLASFLKNNLYKVVSWVNLKALV